MCQATICSRQGARWGGRLYRDSTLYQDGKHLRDLGKLNRDLSKVLLITSDADAYSLHPDNCVKVPPPPLHTQPPRPPLEREPAAMGSCAQTVLQLSSVLWHSLQYSNHQYTASLHAAFITGPHDRWDHLL